MSHGQSADAGVPGNPVPPEPEDGAIAGNLAVGDVSDEAAGVNVADVDAADVPGAEAGGAETPQDAAEPGREPDLEGPPWSEGHSGQDGDEPEVTVADLELS